MSQGRCDSRLCDTILSIFGDFFYGVTRKKGVFTYLPEIFDIICMAPNRYFLKVIDIKSTKTFLVKRDKKLILPDFN